MKSLNKLLLERLVAHRPSRALRLSAETLGIDRVTLRLSERSPLFSQHGGELLEFPIDAVIAQSLLDHSHWSVEEVDFVAAHAPEGPSVLFDIGANIGLMTRQLMHRLPSISLAVCYEPHPLNFLLMSRNLAHLPNCSLVRAALGSAAGQLSFYEDVRNIGNYSLNIDAMRGREYRTSTVECLRSHDGEFLGRLSSTTQDLPIIWKSDTQGFDETIATSLSNDFWQRVAVAVIEISRITRPIFDGDRLASILERFSVRRFSVDPRTQLTVREIIRYAAGSDGLHRDLLLAKGPV